MKDQGHKKHGDRTEIIETTIIPERSGEQTSNLQNQNRTVTSGSMPITYGEPQIISSTPINVTQAQESYFPQQSQPLSQTIQMGQEGVETQHPGTTVRKIIDKTTIEHHKNKEEGIKEKAKDAAEKILGFIPNPFAHKEGGATTELEREKMSTTGLRTEGRIGQNVPITTTTTTYQSNIPAGQSEIHPTTTTKQVNEYPSTGTAHMKCDKSS